MFGLSEQAINDIGFIASIATILGVLIAIVQLGMINNKITIHFTKITGMSKQKGKNNKQMNIGVKGRFNKVFKNSIK